MLQISMERVEYLRNSFQLSIDAVILIAILLNYFQRAGNIKWKTRFYLNFLSQGKPPFYCSFELPQYNCWPPLCQALSFPEQKLLKDERRDLIKEARKRCEGMTAESFTRSNGAAVKAWDLENCRDWTRLDMPVRVVRTLETTTVRRQDTGIVEESTNEWLWVTTISIKHLNIKQFVEVAHHRWDIENKGFNELATFWHLNHVYKHDANAIVAFTLMTMLSYTLFHAFLYLNVKAIARKGKTKRHFQRLIMASFYAYLEKEP